VADVVTRKKEVDDLARVVAKKSVPDAVVWFAYPKGTSKKYTSEITRDTGNQALGEAGFEPVRMVAFIKNLTRDPRALVPKEAKKRVAR